MSIESLYMLLKVTWNGRGETQIQIFLTSNAHNLWSVHHLPSGLTHSKTSSAFWDPGRPEKLWFYHLHILIQSPSLPRNLFSSYLCTDLFISPGPNPAHSFPLVHGFLFTYFQSLNEFRFTKLTLCQTELDIIRYKDIYRRPNPCTWRDTPQNLACDLWWHFYFMFLPLNCNLFKVLKQGLCHKYTCNSQYLTKASLCKCLYNGWIF